MSHPCLTFDAATHEYRLTDGRLVPSVTQILSALGISQDFEELKSFSDHTARQIAYKANLGSVVHADAWSYDDDDLDWETVSPESRPYVEAWAAFRRNTGVRPYARERMVFHADQFFCGTLDGVFLDPRDRLVLVDIKTSATLDEAVRYQTVAYQAAYQFEHPEVFLAERWAVQLTPDKTVPYRVTTYNDWRDWAVFSAFCTTYHHQRRRTSNGR